ncbi:MAG: N-acetylneuraminate synthase family protein [Bacteroidetes bacterium]|nr:N-acetylneuraminate synthase family protein [Bacteroidota bacterium]
MAVEIIAEIAQAHDGSLGIAHSYIDASANIGVNTVKFQMHIADAESSEFEQFRVHFSYEDKTRFDYWKRMEFTLEQWAGIKQHCEDKNLNFLCSPFSIQAVDWLEKLNVKRYKIASGEIENYLLLDIISKTGKPLLLSSGMSSFNELNKAFQFIKNKNGKVEGVFQCTSAYPTPPEKYGLNIISNLKNQYACKVGLSDHSGEIYAPLAAVALGAEIIESHIVFDKTMFGPDAKSSLNVAEFKQLVDGINKIDISLQNKIDKNDIEKYKELKTMFGKSLAINNDVKMGEILKLEYLETKKPANKGISPAQYESIIGKKFTKDLQKNSFLNESDLI